MADTKDSTELNIYVKMAKTRICSLYSDTAGSCYLSFSGGKDSTILVSLIKQLQQEGRIRENAIPAVYANTGIELQATKDFVEWVKNNYYENIVIIEPEKSFSQIIKECGKPFRSKLKSELIRRYRKNPEYKSVQQLLYGHSKISLANKDFHVLHDDFECKISNDCCEYMKKKPFKKYAKENNCLGFMSGIRMNEGGVRELNYKRDLEKGKSPCTKIDGNYIMKYPLIDWSDDICDEYVRNYNVPLSKAYTEYGMTRTGCYLCPYNPRIQNDLKLIFIYEPDQYKAAMFWMKDIFIAQNVELSFDKKYEDERRKAWYRYSDMRYEMLLKYRPDCKIVKDYEKENKGGKQLIFEDFI